MNTCFLQNKQRELTEKKVIEFMRYLFGIYYQSKRITFEEKDWDQLEKWIAAFKKMWFTQKPIHKVIHKIGSTEYSTLLLLPNHNIIRSITNSQNTMLLKNSSHCYYNENEYLIQNFWNQCSDVINQSMLKFTGKMQQEQSFIAKRPNDSKIWDKFLGFIDPVYLIPRGQGKLSNQERQMLFECDQFFYTIPSAKFTYSEFDIQKQKVQSCPGDGSDFRNIKPIVVSDEFHITPNFAKALFDGGWLNQILVDYFIRQYYPQQQLINHREAKYQIVLMDTRQAQDIFSSQITQVDQINLEYANQFFNPINCQENKSLRLVILINVDRCHFICICIEEDTIYILNSMNSTWSDEIVGRQISKIYSLFREKQRQLRNQSCFIEQSANFLELEPKQKVVKVPQQRNAYDCSIYTLFNSMQLIKHTDISVTEINFEVGPKQISELRLQFLHELVNNNAFLSNQKKWYLNSR
ncbi:unnamed protein product (macronuclear) [Paramecium tetraurelia]|uniref:Ubiquitin-like protease family profile domain-containing protein n=1 Tax=Paramecium tetraurelia TaxID=5888 RepID=A0CVV4_PARTE|nr:uncharacterized protein GSPATT00001123001 [Paramecium tetraurelia]CAK74921.1 unnamed protein product [Paramecium tetraurelia]|eukprot:XP_001442318.1 hypothetical protein (macronuclear) [Paramecium tetraurelia strain d4-2]